MIIQVSCSILTKYIITVENMRKGGVKKKCPRRKQVRKPGWWILIKHSFYPFLYFLFSTNSHYIATLFYSMLLETYLSNYIIKVQFTIKANYLGLDLGDKVWVALRNRHQLFLLIGDNSLGVYTWRYGAKTRFWATTTMCGEIYTLFL